MFTKRYAVILAIGGLLALAQSALAGLDISPSGTHQTWSFATADDPTPPDISQNPYGDALASIEYEGTTPWHDNYLGHQGVWEITDWMKIHFPNDDTSAPPPQKDIWIEMVFASDADCENCESQIFISPAYASMEILSTELLDENFIKATYLITLDPASESEDIYILPRDCKIFIDSLTIDTEPVPEPATVLLLAIGSMLSIRRKYP